MAFTGFNVVSWNVNGLRTINIEETLNQLKCSILAIQETKLARDALSEDLALINNFTACFSFCRNRSGYSGVATYCRDEIVPNKSEEGLCGLLNKKYSKTTESLIGNYGSVEECEKANALIAEDDGRSILTQHMVKTPDGKSKMLTIINVYCPRLRNDPDDPINNTEFKYTFHNTLRKRAKSLVEAGSFVIILGDFNIAHKPIDIVDTEDSEMFGENTFRKWIDQLLSDGFVDTFRMLHPDVPDAFTCWCTRTNARQNNYGTRIDYIVVDKQLSGYLEKAEVLSDIHGSDHCPISASFHSLIPVRSERPPPGAAKFYKEFYGKQTNLKDFLGRSNSFVVSSDSNSSQNSTDILSQTKKKRNILTGGKQTDIKNFFVKRAKIESESEQRFVQSESVNEAQKLKIDNLETVKCRSAASEESVVQFKEKPFSEINQDASKMWKNLMTTPNTPYCAGHNELCVLRTVKKKGLNQGKKFWACPRGVGQANDPNANCNFFEWINKKS